MYFDVLLQVSFIKLLKKFSRAKVNTGAKCGINKN